LTVSYYRAIPLISAKSSAKGSEIMALCAWKHGRKKDPKDNLPQQLQEREYPNDRQPFACLE
jgi:hypothetical protein